MLKKLVNEADSVHSSASTVVGDRSTVWGGSVFGDPLTQEQYRGIRDWIPPPIQEESEGNIPFLRYHAMLTSYRRFNC